VPDLLQGARHAAQERKTDLRALTFKWIRVLHRCWIERVSYDEARYRLALQKRRSARRRS
jgi:hypothetical protein